MAPEPFSMALDSLGPNTPQWAGLIVSITSARLVAGRDDQIRASSRLDPGRSYLEVDFEIANAGREEADMRNRNTWDLLLGDGTRVESVGALGLLIFPGDTAITQLHYPVAIDSDLSGAAIQLEGSERGTLEPELIPLDSELVRQFPRRLDGVAGKSVEDSRVRIEIDEAMWDANHALRGRPKRGRRSVWLRLALTYGEDGDHWNGSHVRLSVAGRSSTPWEWDHAILAPYETRTFLIAFEVDAGVEQADLLIPLNTGAGELRYADCIAIDFSDSSLAELPAL
jgi:hypothetical protein